MKLPRSVEAFGTPEFDTVLLDEIEGHLHDLALQDYCRGDFADEIVAEEVSSTDQDDDHIFVDVPLSFSDTTLTGCSDITLSKSGRVRMRVTIDSVTTDAEMEILDVAWADGDGDYM